MDIRLEVLRIDGVWTITQSGPDRFTFPDERRAVDAGIAAARRHRATDGGRATVHLWRNGRETVVFDTHDGADGP